MFARISQIFTKTQKFTKPAGCTAPDLPNFSQKLPGEQLFSRTKNVAMFFYETKYFSATICINSDGKINRIVSSYLAQYLGDGWNSEKVILETNLQATQVPAETKELRGLY